jgi:dTDP-4-dehydrorhamnose reductase
METIIVTGCNGQLGRAINKELNGKYELVNTDVFQGDGITPLDITNVDAVVELARKVKPAAIVNCAAYTAVDKQESDVDLSYKINAIGPRNLAIASTEVGAKLVHVSTDYVFEGNGTRPYVEFVKQFAKESFIIRTAWLYGDGKNFVKTMLSLSEKYDEVSVVKDQLGTPTSTTELAKAIHYLLPTQNYGTFHGTCEGDTNWADFTEEIFRIAGKKTKVNHVTTEEYVAKNPQSAPRPAYSILENYMFKLTSDFMFADWHDAIEQYLKELL